MESLLRRAVLFVFLGATFAWCQSLTPVETSLANATSANALKGYVSFLASDALEGRDTPSSGLDVAAEYIASQYRSFGLQPLQDGTYFQVAPYVVTEPRMDGFQLVLEGEGKRLTLDKSKAGLSSTAALQLHAADVVHVTIVDEKSELPSREAVAGKVVLLHAGPVRSMGIFSKRQAMLKLGAALVVMAGPASSGKRLHAEETDAAPNSPLVTVAENGWQDLIKSLPDGATPYKATVALPAPNEVKVKLRNVIGVIPGTDAELKDTYVLLSAHYDHVGRDPRLTGDTIFNGANDDASGVATVLELARTLSERQERPRRTIVFAMWFGEEKGLLGSRYYVRHPVFPIAKTVANLNFEHMGRTDDTEGPKTGSLTATGFDFSEVGDMLVAAGKDTGVATWKHAANSDAFFGRSDNQALADAGVPAHTICVAWIFPDYHRVGDHWDKIDYANMARVAGTLGVLTWRLAGDAHAPRWHESNQKTARYVEAWKKLTGAVAHAGAQE